MDKFLTHSLLGYPVYMNTVAYISAVNDSAYPLTVLLRINTNTMLLLLLLSSKIFCFYLRFNLGQLNQSFHV